MEKISNILSILFYGSLPFVGICYLVAPDETKELRDFIMHCAYYGIAFCFIGMLLLMIGAALYGTIIQLWKEEPNKILATISILLFLIVFVTFLIMGGNADVPYIDMPFAHPFRR